MRETWSENGLCLLSNIDAGLHLQKDNPTEVRAEAGASVDFEILQLTTHADTLEDDSTFNPFTSTMTSNPIFTEQEYMASSDTL